MVRNFFKNEFEKLIQRACTVRPMKNYSAHEIVCVVSNTIFQVMKQVGTYLLLEHNWNMKF